MRIPRLAIFVLLCLLLCGCRTTDVPDDAQIRTALEQAGALAVDNAFSDILYQDLDTLDFTPPEMAFIEVSAASVPGMTYLLSRWNTSASENCRERISFYPPYFKQLISQLPFDEPLAMLSSDTSVTDLLRRTMYAQVLATVSQRIEENFDDLDFQRIISQYNNHLITESVFTRASYELVQVDVKPYLSTMLTELFFKRLADAETKVRTTPDLGLDSTFVKVFGLGF